MRAYLYLGRVLGFPVGLSANLNEFGRKSTRGSAQDCVYVIERPDGHVKVGVTCNPRQRIKDLQTGSSLPLTYRCCLGVSGDAYAVETEAHRLLDRYHLRGDWFEVSPQAAMDAVWQAADNLAVPVGVAAPVHGWSVGSRIFIVGLLVAAVVMYYTASFISAANLGTVYNPVP